MYAKDRVNNMKNTKSIVALFFCAAVIATTVSGCGGVTGLLGHLVSMDSGSVFNPKTVTVGPGDTVTWTNADAIVHSVVADVSGGPDSTTDFPNGLATGDIYEWTVPNAPSGTKYYYHCGYQGTAGNGTTFGTGMVGVIVVQ